MSREIEYNRKESLVMDVFQLRCSDMEAASLSDYRRGAYGISCWFGVKLQSVDTICKFAMVVHQHKKSPNSVLVEVFRKIDGEWEWGDKKNVIVPISPEVMKKLTANTIFHDFVVEYKGHAFIKGMKIENPECKRPSYDLCQCTNAFDFLKKHGNALATALAYPDVVHDIDEGTEFNSLISDVRNFMNEMKGSGLFTCGINNANKRIKDIQENMVSEDKSIRENYEIWRSAVDTLAHYGIGYKREKAEPIWL